MAIPVPNHPLMTTLFFLERGYRLEPSPDDGRLVVTGRETYDPPYLADALDELEAKGWLAVGEAGAAITGTGHWHLMAWLKRVNPTLRRIVERGWLDRYDYEVRG